MIMFNILNYSTISNKEIGKILNNFIECLKFKGIYEQFDIKFCGEEIKTFFLEDIVDESKKPLIDNDCFLLQLNDYLGGISNSNNMLNNKFVFIGEEIPTYNDWGEANDWVAIIKKVEEKVIWHELAHLVGAIDHYDTKTYQPLDICADSEKCIMTFGNLNGSFCNQSTKEMKDYFDR